jgi:HEAT repeat protein
MLSLSNVLAHGDANARDLAVKELVRFQRSLFIVLPALSQMAKAPEAASRQMAIVGFGALRVADNTTIYAATNALHDESAEVRLAAVKCLKGMIWRAHEAVPQLVELLRDDSAAVRGWSVLTLGEIGPRAATAIPELQRVAENDPGLRPAAAEAIRKIGTQ